MRAWVRSHNFDANWGAVDAIHYVLALWNGELRPGQRILLPVRSDAEIDEEAELEREIVQVRITLPPLVWHLSSTPRAGFEGIARQAFEAALSHRLDAIERAAAEAGFEPFAPRPAAERDLDRPAGRAPVLMRGGLGQSGLS